jgi:catechol 2,3-dioxygenase-like lactoylglutathione lyase family enzyme/predicted SnoaL-like aldol condensation-catalyzing enzyme
MIQQFRGICLVTRDVPRLRLFYETVLQIQADGDEHYAEFPVTGAGLSLFAAEGMEQMAPGSITGAGSGNTTLEFEVADVDEEYKRLVALDVPIVKVPTTQPWGVRSVWFRDPDGNPINFFARVRSGDTKTLVRQYFDRLLNQRDVSVCDEMLAPDYVDHDAPASTPPGPDSVKAFVTQFLANYPDLQVQIDDMVAEGDKVAARIVWRGTHKETGDRLFQMGNVIIRLNAAHQFIERWSAYKAL